jgi:hypothetical protein
MKLRCISKSNKNNVFYDFVELDKEYNCYGIILIDGEVHFYICDQVHESFPVARPADLFEIVDNRLSRYWVFGIVEGDKKYPTWMFPEWINEPYFQDQLTDEEEREVSIFKSYKELMDLEFPDPSISKVAQIAGADWLICPECQEAWNDSNSSAGMLKCPNCSTLMHNPRCK